MQELPLTLKGSASKVISSPPQNFPSSRSSSYLLQGPRVGSLVISGKQVEGDRKGEGGREGGRRGEGGKRGEGGDREGGREGRCYISHDKAN